MISRHAVWGQPVVFGDPAGNQRAQTSGVSIIDIYRAHGLHVVTKPEAQRFKERFTRTQMLLPDLEVNLVEDSDIDDCAELDEAILNARFPERGADATTTSEILKPIHNWTSHYRSALEYLAVNLPRRRMGLRRRPAPVRARYVYEV